MQMRRVNLLKELIKIQNSQSIQFTLIVNEIRYQLSNVIISEKSTPLSKKMVRGGVYISDKLVYQINATIFDSMLANSLSNAMLGPSFEFKDLVISVDGMVGKSMPLSIIVNLVTSVQKQSKTELTMNIVRVSQK